MSRRNSTSAPTIILRSMIAAMLLLVLALLLLWPSGPNAGAGSEPGPVQGDADCSGAVDRLDGLTMLRYEAFLGGVPCTLEGDVNCDGLLNLLDALAILRHGSGFVETAGAGCPQIGESAERGPTGEELIELALESGEIDLSTSVLYKAYWAFGDPRLPEEFDAPGRGLEVPDEIWLRPAGLSPEVEAQLDRYLLPPSAPESWYYTQGEAGGPPAAPQGPSATPAATAATVTPAAVTPPVPAGGWSSVTSPSGRVKVWWDNNSPDDEGKAELYARDVDIIWDIYTELMPKQPMADGGVSAPHGGDALYDIYLAPLAGLNGFVAPYEATLRVTNPCPAMATFMALDRALDPPGSTLAHELLHSFQRGITYADSCEAPNWLLEGTAKWTEDYLYPNLDEEHQWNYFTSEHQRGLDSWDGYGYSSWVFFFYLARTGSPEVVGDIFAAAQTTTVMNAVNTAIPGGLQQRWPEFALYAWNHAPFDYFYEWDDIVQRPEYRNLDNSSPGKRRLPTYLTLAEGESRKEYSAVDTEVFALGMQYHYLSLVPETPTANEVGFLTINNPWGGATPPGAAVQLAYSVGGVWRVTDLSDKAGVSFCRQKADENVEEVVLIVSNSKLPPGNESPPFTSPVAVVNDLCDGWRGSAAISWVDGPAEFERRHTMTASGLVFREAEDGDGTTFKLEEGTLTWEVDLWVQLIDGVPQRIIPIEFCYYRGSASRALDPGEGEIKITDAGPGLTYNLFGVAPLEVVAQLSCRNDPSQAYDFLARVWLCSGRDQQSGSKTLVEGSYVFNTDDVSAPICGPQSSTEKSQPYFERDGPRSITYTWSLEKVGAEATPRREAYLRDGVITKISLCFICESIRP